MRTRISYEHLDLHGIIYIYITKMKNKKQQKKYWCAFKWDENSVVIVMTGFLHIPKINGIIG